MLRISSLQSRLDEQRHRAEELHRQGTSDLNIRVHDLKVCILIYKIIKCLYLFSYSQNEVANLKETLSSRDKQISTLRSHLEESKKLIDRQESEIAQMAQTPLDAKHEYELRHKNDEIQRLKDKIKNEMINKIALPDLMETMLADKNEEIDHLKEQIQMKEKELNTYYKIGFKENNAKDMQLQRFSDVDGSAKGDGDGKMSARTLSDIVSISSEFDEPDIVRKMADPNALDHGGFTFNIQGGILSQNMVSFYLFFLLYLFEKKKLTNLILII